MGNQLLGGRYRLVGMLGTGGMSVVWRGYDQVLDRQVAVKVLNSSMAADRTVRHRIRLEAQAAARLCHPNITSVYDYGETTRRGGDTVPFVVMELVDGYPLARRLAGAAALPWPEAVAACADVAAALAAAHARGIVHRDVTPHNVMLTAAGAKVVDFGISALVGEVDLAPDGTLLGTPAYLAPERLAGRPVGPATDVYALGLLAYRALTGELPWHAATTAQMLRAHLYTEPAPLPPVDGLPGNLAGLVLACLAKEPADRPRAGIVARAFGDAVGRSVVVAGENTDTQEMSQVDTEELSVSATATLPRPTDTAGSPPGPRSFHGLRGARGLRGVPGVRGLRGVRSVRGLHDLRGRHRGVRRSRGRVAAGLVAAFLVSAAVFAWFGSGTTEASGGALAADLASATSLVGGLPVSCQVRYQIRQATGRRFTAAITVTNTGPEPLSDWRLGFTLPGDQRLASGSAGGWRQSGREVTGVPAAPLGPGASTELTLVGTNRGLDNQPPTAFDVNGYPCHVPAT